MEDKVTMKQLVHNVLTDLGLAGGYESISPVGSLGRIHALPDTSRLGVELARAITKNGTLLRVMYIVHADGSYPLSTAVRYNRGCYSEGGIELIPDGSTKWATDSQKETVRSKTRIYTGLINPTNEDIKDALIANEQDKAGIDTETFGPLSNNDVVARDVAKVGTTEVVQEPENPKKAWGAQKATALSCTPTSALIALGSNMAAGAYKYGAFNFREATISTSTYTDAIFRHFLLFLDGEDYDPVDVGEGKPPGSGEHHLACIMSACALMLDAQALGKLDDDRQKTGLIRGQLDGAAERQAAFREAHDKFEAARETDHTEPGWYIDSSKIFDTQCSPKEVNDG